MSSSSLNLQHLQVGEGGEGGGIEKESSFFKEKKNVCAFLFDVVVCVCVCRIQKVGCCSL
jgi:hypothetical protein